MPRSKVKKIVTARTAPRAEAAQSAPVTSAITATNPNVGANRGDDKIQSMTKTTATRAPRQARTVVGVARSTRSSNDRAAQEIAVSPQRDDTQAEAADELEKEDIAETLVQATQEEVELPQTTPPVSGRRSKRLRNGLDETTANEASVEPAQKSQSRIPSSPPPPPFAPASVARVHNTPSYLTNFRRQPRQPSILNMVQQNVGHGGSDEEDLTLEGETDLLGDTTNVQEKEGADAEGLYDEDVPTMLSSSSRKRKVAELETDGHITSSRAATPLHRPDTTDPPSDPAHLTEPISDVMNDDEEDDLTPDDSASHAAPRSSPPVQDDQRSAGLPSPRVKSRKPRRPGRLIRRRSAGRGVAQDNASSSSPISASPPHSTPPSSPVNTQAQTAKSTAATRKGAKRDKVITLTTAALQALLPQTRKLKSDRQHDTFDIHSSSTLEEEDDVEVDEDEDELSRPRRRAAVPPARARKVGALKSPKVTRGKAADRPVMSKAAKTNKTSKARATVPAAKTAEMKTRTYTRRSQGDKENEGGESEDEPRQDDDNSDVTVMGKTVKSGELKDARKKFEEVDNWEMEFESADITGGSSPWR